MQFQYLTVGLLALASSVVFAAPVAETDAESLLPTPIDKRATAAGSLTAVVTVTPSAGGSVGNVLVKGSPVPVIFDTGSNILWIHGNGDGPTFSQGYGDGTVSGNLAFGDVTIGGITVKNQTYGLVNSYTNDYYGSIGGIMGLGIAPTGFQGRASTWLHQALPQMQSPRLSVNIPASGTGTFTFGTVDSRYANQLNWAGYSTSKPYAQVDVSSFGVSSGDAKMACTVDTGTTDIITPASVANGFWTQVKGASKDTSSSGSRVKYMFPCDSSIPSFVATIGGVKYSDSGDNLRAYIDKSANQCGGFLQGDSFCILGQKFFYSVYTVFDFGSTMVGFASKA